MADEKKEEKEKGSETLQKPEQKEGFDAWLKSQSADVQEMYSTHVGGLKSALDKERDATKQAQGEAQTLRNAQQSAVETQLEQQEKYQELSEERGRKLAELQPVADSAEAYKKALEDSNAKRIESIPEDLRSFVPDYESPVKLRSWLDENTAKLQKPSPANFDAGKLGSGNNKKGVDLTNEQKSFARMAGMTDEEYAKQLD